MISVSAYLQRRATDQLGPPESARPAVSYTTSRDIIIRRLIRAGVLPAEQVVRGAPCQIRADDSTRRRITPRQPETVARVASPIQTRFQGLQIGDKGMRNDSAVAKLIATCSLHFSPLSR